MSFEQMAYAQCQQMFARMAALVAKANSGEELAALLLADTQAPYHTFDLMVYPNMMANLVDRIGVLLYEAMDDGEEVQE